MTDILLEILRTVILGAIVLFLIVNKDSKELLPVKGWKFFLVGFSLLFFGTILDITDNYEPLNSLVILGDTPLQAILEQVVGYLFGFCFIALGISKWIPNIIELKRLKNKELEKAKEKIETLKTMLPMCAHCKKVRDDQGYWDQLETYISEHTPTELSHCICPNCAQKLYPEFAQDVSAQPTTST